VRLALDVEAVFDDFGLYQLYEEAAGVVGRRDDAAADALWEAVATPLPMTGTAPDWTDGALADALRRAGLTYLERAAAGD